MYRLRTLGNTAQADQSDASIPLLGRDPTRRLATLTEDGVQFVEVATRWTQRALNARGMTGADGQPLTLDNKYGPNTAHALDQAAVASGKRGLGLSMPVIPRESPRILMDTRLEIWLAETRVPVGGGGSMTPPRRDADAINPDSGAGDLTPPPPGQRTSGVDTTTVVLAAVAAAALGVGLYMARRKRSGRSKG